MPLPSCSSYQFYCALRPSHPGVISWELNHCKRAENISLAGTGLLWPKHWHQTKSSQQTELKGIKEVWTGLLKLSASPLPPETCWSKPGACLTLPRIAQNCRVRRVEVSCPPGHRCRGHVSAMHWKWGSTCCPCSFGEGVQWCWMNSTSPTPGRRVDALSGGGTRVRATKGSSLLCTKCFSVLQCTTPAWDIPCRLRAVVAELTWRLHWLSKTNQSLFPLFVLWQYLKGWARWCCMAWHKHWVRDICHFEELMQEPPHWSSLGLLSLQRNQSQNSDSSSELYVNAQLQMHTWLLHKPSERNQVVKFSRPPLCEEKHYG